MRASTERKRLERKRARQAELGLIETQHGIISGIEITAAAVHEAAHVVAGFHWNVPIGKRGVSLTPGRRDVAGFSDTMWSTLQNNAETLHASHVGTVIAPFAEFNYRAGRDDADLNAARLISSARADFAMLSPSSPDSVGRMCFLIWMDNEPEHWNSSPEVVAHVRRIVRDADTMLRAYWRQIVGFAKALMVAENFQLSARDVNAWRDENFQRRSVSMTAL